MDFAAAFCFTRVGPTVSGALIAPGLSCLYAVNGTAVEKRSGVRHTDDCLKTEMSLCLPGGALTGDARLSLSDENDCWDYPLPGMKKILLLCLARVATPDKRVARVRMQKMAAMCGLSENTVRKMYRELGFEGYLEPLTQPRGILHYRLTIGTGTRVLLGSSDMPAGSGAETRDS